MAQPFAVAGGALLSTTLRARHRQRQETIEAEVLRVLIFSFGAANRA